MKTSKNIFRRLAIVLSMFAVHFLMDVYKIGIKDGAATKASIVKQQKLKN
ncbi:hypothetical protein BDD43_5251 [Mucilaginibacter gracilis]|uniref:Uncharacterized protein n=1 Tax=Mucilaginibacter gracilis TaxID=423350 RepID=A0A495J7N0_9SPHI|nr:hypothetical protein [Mucilaginibacter gracilis]RKR84995.1 hypothetical protein BDD43_5251 [Mucilaginibacter gracilis]